MKKPTSHDGITKLCCGCKNRLPLSMFYSQPRKNSVWYSGKCKPCFLEHYRKYRASKRGKDVYRIWSSSERGKAVIKKRMKRWESQNKLKHFAQTKVSNALRDGRLQRLPCRICGNLKSEAHHISYENPFNIDWLCKPCHTNVHWH